MTEQLKNLEPDVDDLETPLTNSLLVALINKGVVREGTKLVVPRPGKDLSGSDTIPFNHFFEVIETKIEDGIGYCAVKSIEDEAECRVRAEIIKSIDGMDSARIARSFGLNPDGSPRSLGKKRGRKPKNRK